MHAGAWSEPIVGQAHSEYAHELPDEAAPAALEEAPLEEQDSQKSAVPSPANIYAVQILQVNPVFDSIYDICTARRRYHSIF